MSAPSRNEQCSCGSGRRYKHCCGAIASQARVANDGAADLRGMMNAALSLQNRGDLAGAEALYRQVLAIKADEPDTLHMLGVICYLTQRHAEALKSISRAIDLTGGRIMAMYDNLGLALSAALVVARSEFAARMRTRYVAWKSGLAAQGARGNPPVTVVLVVQDRPEALAASLESVFAQSYSQLDLVVVVNGDDRGIRACLASSPFSTRVVDAQGMSPDAALNRGMQGANGEFIALLMAGDRYSADRVETMVERVARCGGEWGFSAVFDSRTGKIPEAFAAVSGCDSAGFALLEAATPLAAASNLFFSRKLFDELGGFDASATSAAHDFALRALIQREPFFIEQALGECAFGGNTKPTNSVIAPNVFDDALRRFYHGAATTVAPANPFAPVLEVWQLQFISWVTSTRNLHYLPRDTLQRFIDAGVAAQATAAGRNEQRLPGLDLVSFFGGEFGIAESARGIAQSCRLGDIPFGLRSIDAFFTARAADHSMDAWLSNECRHAAILLMFNPDNYANTLPQLGNGELSGRYKIGYWYWETEEMPAEWLPALDLLDEIWVATEFVAAAIRKFTDKPVLKIRPPISVTLSRQYSRTEFGLEHSRFLFLFSFDFGSYAERKNPQAAIRAFQMAFPRQRQDVGLVIKSQGGSHHPQVLRAVEDMCRRDPRIALIDRRMSRDEVYGLQSVCDSFVSLHRSEGLGLGLAECMAQGKPVIGTAYSGNLEFMNESNSCLVAFDRIPIRTGTYRYDQPGLSWAEPRLESAAGHMAQLADDPDYRSKIAVAAMSEIRNGWNHEVTATAIRRRLQALGLLDGPAD